MARHRKTLDRLKQEVREKLKHSPLPMLPTLFPRHLFPYLGRYQTYTLLHSGVIPAAQSCEGGVYMIYRDQFLAWINTADLHI